jgi:hypothetical protein
MIDPPMGIKRHEFKENEEFIVTAGGMPTTLGCYFYAVQVCMSSENDNSLGAKRGQFFSIFLSSIVKRDSSQAETPSPD